MEHITTMTLKLAIPESTQISPVQASAAGPYLQGVLMEKVNATYADSLHHLAFNPYSQYCVKDSDANALVWRVSALTDEASEQMISPLMKLDSVEVKGLSSTFEISKKSTETVSIKALTDLIHDDAPKRASVSFVTPASFKSKGEYVFMPSSKLVLQNLLMHYCQVYEGDKEIDGETLAYLEQKTRITSYNLRSRYFEHVAGKGSAIPSFVGSIVLNVDGPPTMVGLVRMLLKFGEFAGVGIKTSMGMGGLRCQ